VQHTSIVKLKHNLLQHIFLFTHSSKLLLLNFVSNSKEEIWLILSRFYRVIDHADHVGKVRIFFIFKDFIVKWTVLFYHNFISRFKNQNVLVNLEKVVVKRKLFELVVVCAFSVKFWEYRVLFVASYHLNSDKLWVFWDVKFGTLQLGRLKIHTEWSCILLLCPFNVVRIKCAIK